MSKGSFAKDLGVAGWALVAVGVGIVVAGVVRVVGSYR